MKNPQSAIGRPFRRFGKVASIVDHQDYALVKLAGPSGFQQDIILVDPAFRAAVSAAGEGANVWARVTHTSEAPETRTPTAIYLSLNGQKIEPSDGDLIQTIAPITALT